MAAASLFAIFSVVMAILWLVIGWRAMRAHERLARAAENFVSQQHLKLQREVENSANPPS